LSSDPKPIEGTTLNAKLHLIVLVLFTGTEWYKCEGNNTNNPGSKSTANSVQANLELLLSDFELGVITDWLIPPIAL
jgi:hypothetical protein